MPNPYSFLRTSVNREIAQPEQKSSPYRYVSVDALRGMSALAVLLFHAWSTLSIYPWPSTGAVTTTTNPSLLFYFASPMRWGFLGVSMFLLLSGFCIHLPQARRRALRTDSILDLPKFAAARFWRLYPTYVITLFGTILFLLVLGLFPLFDGLGMVGHTIRLREVLTHLSFTHIFFETHAFRFNPPFWSLALEFQLYLFYPIFFILSRRFGTGRFLLLATVVSIGYRLFALQYNDLFLIGGGTSHVLLLQLPARMVEWFLGAWLAETWVADRSWLTKLRTSQAVVGGALLIFAGIASTYFRGLWSLTDLIFGVGFLFFLVVALRKEESFNRKFLSWTAKTGLFSYTLYLIHYPLILFAVPFLKGLPSEAALFILLLWAAVIVLLASWIFRRVELPFLGKPPTYIVRLFTWLRKGSPPASPAIAD